jgi:hypothetical protein
MAYELKTPGQSADGRTYTHVAMIEGKAHDVDEDTHSVLATMSSQTEDRDGDTIMVDKWQTARFNEHPVLVSSHDYGGGFLGAGSGLTRQIGRWAEPYTQGDELLSRPSYMVGRGNPEADWGWELARDGMAAYSVGFIATTEPEEIKGKDGKRKGLRFVGQELIECSHVIIPAHPDALQRAIAKSSRPADPSVLAIMQRMQGNHYDIDLDSDWRSFTVTYSDGSPVLYGIQTDEGIEFEAPDGGGALLPLFTEQDRQRMMRVSETLVRYMGAGHQPNDEPEQIKELGEPDSADEVRRWFAEAKERYTRGRAKS